MFEEFYGMYEPKEQEVVALIKRCIGGGYSLWLSELSPSFSEWPVCELLLGRLKERVHKGTESTGGS